VQSVYHFPSIITLSSQSQSGHVCECYKHHQ